MLSRELKKGAKILMVLTVGLSSLESTAFDIFGRSADNCVNNSGVTKCGHGPAVTDPSLKALYRFDTLNWDAGIGAYRIEDLTANNNDLKVILPSSVNPNTAVSAGYVARGVELMNDPVTGQANQQVFYLDIMKPTLIQSINKFNATECKNNKELTIEAWLRNDREDDLIFQRGPLKIVSMSSASNNTNFYLGYNYDNAAQYNGSVRIQNRSTQNVDIKGLDSTADDYPEETSNEVLTSQDSDTNKILRKDRIQHVIFTHRYSASDELGSAKLFVSTAVTQPVIWAPTERSSSTIVSPNFNGWGDFNLNIGNDPLAFSDGGQVIVSQASGTTVEDRDWRGNIFLLAVYCRGLSDEEVLGNSNGNTRYKSYGTDVNAMVSKAHILATQIYRRITGVGIPMSAPIISGDPNDSSKPYMVQHVKNYLNGSDKNGLYKAALVATEEDNFYNITVRDMAKRMSVRNESVSTPFNDMVAFFIGHSSYRNAQGKDADARELLTGNVWWSADPTLAAVPDDLVSDILTSNNHYMALENQGYNLRKVLKRNVGQKIFTGTGVLDHPKPAGVLTSRAFMAAHSLAGTNRRLVEYTFREFMCVSMEQWANAKGPDEWVGADVDRFPGGDHNQFRNQCRGCHSNMDSFRGAFAKFNFANNFVKYADHFTGRVANNENNENENNMYIVNGVAGKLNRNPLRYPCAAGEPDRDGQGRCPAGKVVTNDAWVNNSNIGLNAGRFGFRGEKATGGSGPTDFGRMIADSHQFSKCLTRRVFRATCRREPKDFDETMISSVANEFEKTDGLNYSLRKLFARVAVAPECTGD